MASVAKQLVERLLGNGIRHGFGVPGDYVLKCFDILSKNLNMVGCCNELNAAYAADAYARVNGLGCLCVTYGVGGFSALNGVACAYAEKSPVIVISGAPGLNERGTNIRQHHTAGSFNSQYEMFKEITCDQTILNDMDSAGYEIDRVLNSAKFHKQPVYIEIPRDMIDKSIRYDAYSRGTPKMPQSDEQILKESIEETVGWLAQSKNPVLWVGVEAARFNLGKKIMRWAEANNIPVATTILGKSVVNESHPLCMGVYCPTIANDEQKEFMESSDCVVMLGVMMTDMNLGFLPLKYSSSNAVCANVEEIKIKNHFYHNVLFPDFVEKLCAIKLPQRATPQVHKQKVCEINCEPKDKITAEKFFSKVAKIITPQTAIIADIGDSLFGALSIPVQDSNKFISDAFYTSMGFSVPAALGVSMACPESRPIVLVGDGAFQMTGNEFSSLVRHNTNSIVFVLNNGGYQTERLLMDGPYNDIQNWNFEAMASLVGGGKGFRCSTMGELDIAINEAVNYKGVSILNVIVDKNDHSSTLSRLFSNLAKKV